MLSVQIDEPLNLCTVQVQCRTAWIPKTAIFTVELALHLGAVETDFTDGGESVAHLNVVANRREHAGKRDATTVLNGSFNAYKSTRDLGPLKKHPALGPESLIEEDVAANMYADGIECLIIQSVESRIRVGSTIQLAPS